MRSAERLGMEVVQVDMDARYRVSYYGGVAFYLLGYAVEWTEESWEYVGEGSPDVLTCPDCGEEVWDGPDGGKLAKCWNTEGHADGGPLAFEGDHDWMYCEPEEVENRQMVRAVMVGDDHVHLVDVDDLEVIGELDYCACCGQIGCEWDGRDRSES